MKPTRTIVIGDIHGCYEEFQDLLEKVRPTPEDRLIAVGDLMCRGPSSVRVLETAMGIKNFKCVLGNHEFFMLSRWREKALGQLALDYQQAVLAEMGRDIDKYFHYINSWPLYLETDDYIVLHAGIRPGLPLADQNPDDIVCLRTLGDDKRPWFDFYTGDKLIVHGHCAKTGLVLRQNVIGLDTGCVYGKKLTAVILPERRIVSVPARKPYYPV